MQQCHRLVLHITTRALGVVQQYQVLVSHRLRHRLGEMYSLASEQRIILAIYLLLIQQPVLDLAQDLVQVLLQHQHCHSGHHPRVNLMHLLLHP